MYQIKTTKNNTIMETATNTKGNKLQLTVFLGLTILLTGLFIYMSSVYGFKSF